MTLDCKKGCGKCCDIGGTAMRLPVTRMEALAVSLAIGRPMTSPSNVSANASCPAFDATAGACTAYEARPKVCRNFQCDGEDRFNHTPESLVLMEELAADPEPKYDLRSFFPETTKQVLSRHERIAFQFSGGKDSTAALLLLRPFWDKLTVYYCDSGDAMPETTAIVEQMNKLVPITTVWGRVHETRANYGLPTDVLPWTSASAAHQLNTGSTPLMQDRVSCCFRSVMEPIYERMVADKVTLVIRGQKDIDNLKGSLRSGDVSDGVEYLYPVQGWTDDECFAYMREHGFEPQQFYAEGLSHSGDCMHCTAWLGDDKAQYLMKYYPSEYPKYRTNIQLIADSVAPHLVNLMKEATFCEVEHG